VAEAESREIEISVSDTGCGIPEDQIERLFEPFFSTKGRKGTGLGLAVAWGIAEKHNGRIEVESEVGKGSTFRVLLPIGE
jgi:signal transduction histidine kinase